MTTNLKNRKKQLEDRLTRHGIKDYRVDYLPYLEFDDKTFATPFEVGCRMIILYAVAFTATNIEYREAIKNWLIREGIWEHVSPREREFFDGNANDKEQLIDFSWQGECAYILAWALSIIKEKPSPIEPVNEHQFDIFYK
ncbi:MAG: DUF4272 domain-containing protein [Bacteroidales bacterium]|nr:DUF4272 domain-containing protein [Bacteroidales bacterium]